MSKPIKEIVIICIIHDVNFGNVAEQHERSIAEDLSRKVDFVLADRLLYTTYESVKMMIMRKMLYSTRTVLTIGTRFREM